MKKIRKSSFPGKLFLKKGLAVVSLIAVAMVIFQACGKKHDPAPQPTITVTTLAGSTEGFADGPGANAQFRLPSGVAVDAAGNVYVADAGNGKIRKITPDGNVNTLAGSTPGFADGQGANAQFYAPSGVAVDADGNVYVADWQNSNKNIRKITPGGSVSTLPDANPELIYPYDVAVDVNGYLYVADWGDNKIRKITPGGIASTLAGSTEGFADGQGADAKFSSPEFVAVDASGNVYVGDTYNHKIRKISPGGFVTTLAGTSAGFADGASGQFSSPMGVAVDASGNVYVADHDNTKIRKVTPSGIVSTVAGSTQGFAGGTGANAQFNFIQGVAVDASGNIYVADSGNNRIRKIVIH